MYYQSCAAKGAQYGSGQRHLHYRQTQRAAVNIYKTETSYEMLVFAPGRIKENFAVQVKGNEGGHEKNAVASDHYPFIHVP